MNAYLAECLCTLRVQEYHDNLTCIFCRDSGYNRTLSIQ